MSEFETVEQKQLIAERRAPGDRWVLVSEPNEIIPTLTETLEKYFQQTKFNKAFYLDPLGGALYSVDRVEIEKEPIPIQNYDFYGDGY